ncbi:MAG: zinc-binding dehydrogenase [Bacteroidales bacterium]|jgi:NADPH:quinone reductase-like Zn-dependent oxidoreductase
MKSVILPQYNRNVLRAILSLKVEQTKKKIPARDEVVIKVHAAPINPSDIAFIQGGYNVVKTLPAVPGFEGSGTIVEVGSGLAHLKGKKVSFFAQSDSPGSWAEFITVRKNDLIVLKDEMDLDQAACLAINPFTAFGLFSIVLERECTAVIVNAAGGQVPAFIRKLAAEHGVEVINVARNPGTLGQLKRDGQRYVLDETDEKFSETLHNLAYQLEATVAFDAVGGPQSGVLFNAMPQDSELVVYGGLSNKPMNDLSVMDIIFRDKLISGFNLSSWMQELEEAELEAISIRLQDQFISGKWKTQIQSTIPLEEVVSGLRSYLGNMSKGKVLLKP